MVVVPNDSDVNCSFGMSYTPDAITIVIAGSPAPMSGYAPLSWLMVMCNPTMRPSRVAPISTDCSCPRPWPIATRFSLRVSAHRTGRPSSRASHAVRISSGVGRLLAPKPPPTSRLITRTWLGSRPR